MNLLALSGNRLRTFVVAATLVVAGTGGGMVLQSTSQDFDAQKSYVVVGLGDSVQSGYNCACSGYVTTLTDSLAKSLDQPPVPLTEAVPGFTTDDVLSQLSDPLIQRDVGSADLVVIEIGANDFDEDSALDDSCVGHLRSCYGSQLDQTKRNLSQIVARVRLFNSDARIVLAGYWNVFLDGAVARAQGQTYVTVSRELTLAFNDDVKQVAAAQGAIYADVYTPFETVDTTSLLSPDGDHPNAAGQRVLASAVVKAVETATAKHGQGVR